MKPLPAGCLDPDTREGLARGTLGEAVAAAAHTHLETCPTCRRLVELLAPTQERTPATRPDGGPPPATPVPEAIGRFRILERLGAGGMGVVFRAFDPRLERQVALKILRPGAGDGAGRAPLLREARALARLSDPAVVAVHEVGEVDDGLFLAMELVDGVTLRRWLAGGPRRRAILDRFLAAGRGLAAAHRAGLVHGDFKPDNVLCGRDGRVQVADFGLARLQQESAPVATGPAPAAAGDDGGGTRSGLVMGTPTYMAPEQHLGQRADARSDQFAFAVALWQALAGSHPFGGGSDTRLLAERVLGGRIDEPAGARLPRRIRRALERSLAVDPQRRFPSMEALLEVLGRPPWWQRWPVQAGAGGALLAAAVAGTLLLAPEPAAHRCGDAAGELAGVWDGQVRQAVRRGFAATGLGFAPQTLERVEPRLDAYATRWADAHVDACEDTRVRGELSEDMLDRRMECLAGRRRSLAAATALLSTASADVVERAAAITAALPAIEGCSDLEAIAAAVPPPADPAAAAGVAAVREELAAITVDYLAGRFAAAHARATTASARADSLSYAPLRAEVAVLRGKIELVLGRLADAERSLLAGLAAAQASRYDALVAEALNLLIETIDTSPARAAEAERLVIMAGAAVDRLGPSSEARLGYLVSLASLRHQQGRYHESLEISRNALAANAQLGRAEETMVIAILDRIGRAQESLGQLAEAGDTHRRVLELRERVLGPDHPDVAGSLESLAIISCMEGGCRDAPALLERGIALLDRSVGQGHRRSVRLLGTLATVQMQLGQLAEAETTYRTALARSALVDDETGIARLEVNFAILLRHAGRPDEAEGLYRSSLARKVRLYGDDHPLVASTLINLGVLVRERGRAAEALRLHEQAVAIFERGLGAGHRDSALARLNAAESARASRRPALAREHAGKALAAAETIFGADRQLVAYLIELATAEAAAGGSPGRARALLARARGLDPDADEQAAIAALQARLGR